MTTVNALLDAILGWTLAVPRLGGIALLAIITSFGMTLIRRTVTDQDLLHRCRNDQIRLKQRIRGARREKDWETIRRCRATAATIRLMQLRAEVRVLLFALIPLGLLGAWALERVPHRSPPAGELMTLEVQYRATASGSLTHLVPLESLPWETPPIQRVPATEQIAPRCQWSLRAVNPADVLLIVRCKGQSVELPVRIGRWTAFASRKTFESGPVESMRLDYPETAIPLTPLRLDRWLPDPEWVWWYLAFTLLLMPVSRRILRTA